MTSAAARDATLRYVEEEPPTSGEVRELAPGLRWLRMPLPLALDHINLWLVQEAEQWVAVDTGLATSATQQAWQHVLAQHRVSRLLVTHYHPDHFGLAAWLQAETGAPLWMTLGEFATATLVHGHVGAWSFAAIQAYYRQHGATPELAEALEARGPAYRKGVPEIPASFSRLVDGDTLTIGAESWQVIVGRGHSPEHASLYCAARRVLISGDMLLPRISSNIPAHPVNPEDNPLQQFLTSLARLRDLPADTLVLPSHGRPFRGLHQRIAQLEAHHAERCAALVQACAKPQTALALLPVLFERPLYDAHQIFFALGEAIAHLNYLYALGRLKREARDGVYFFVVH